MSSHSSHSALDSIELFALIDWPESFHRSSRPVGAAIAIVAISGARPAAIRRISAAVEQELRAGRIKGIGSNGSLIFPSVILFFSFLVLSFVFLFFFFVF